MLPALIKGSVIYFILISAVAFFVTVYDKYAAKKGMWRIPEKTLFFIAALGGAVSMYLTMLAVRHKTRHKRFMLGIPTIIAVHISLVYFIHALI